MQSTTFRAGRRITSLALGVGCGLALSPAAPAPAAGPRADKFAGNCRFAGRAVTDPEAHRFRVGFAGTCTGVLNGRVVVEAPVRIDAAGRSTDIGTVPVLA